MSRLSEAIETILQNYIANNELPTRQDPEERVDFLVDEFADWIVDKFIKEEKGQS